MSIPSLEGVKCYVCNDGVLVGKRSSATSPKYPDQAYYVCSNYQFHEQHKDREDPLRSPWILATNGKQVEGYLKRAQPEVSHSSEPAFFKKPKTAPAAPAPAAAIQADHVLVTISAKVANLEGRLEHLISLFEAKNSNNNAKDQESSQ